MSQDIAIDLSDYILRSDVQDAHPEDEKCERKTCIKTDSW